MTHRSNNIIRLILGPSLLVFGLFQPIVAKAGLLDVPGLATLVSEKAKESEACGLVSFDGKIAGGAWLPIWKFHAKSDISIEYLRIGAGGAIKQGESFQPLAITAANLPALSARLWSSQWAQDHLTRTKFPPLWIGPSLRVPFPGESFRWDEWRERIGVILSVGF